MAKQWIKQQVKHNELQDWLAERLDWVLAHRQTSLGVGGGVLGALLIGIFLIYRNAGIQNEAWDRLFLAQIYAYGGRPDLSMNQVQELIGNYANTKASGFALLFSGDIYYRQALYKEAADTYAKVLDRGFSLLEPLALSNMALAQESGGLYAQAAATGQRFLDAYPEHFLAPHVCGCQARSLAASGRPDQAKVVLQKITLQYPDTSWAGWAQNRLAGK